jgi:cytidyltransferase-like protein
MTRVAVFPGSFDPMTNAHLDVARRASGLYDALVIGVLNNPKKQPLFDIHERVDLIRACVADLGAHVSVDALDGLTVDFAQIEELRTVARLGDSAVAYRREGPRVVLGYRRSHAARQQYRYSGCESKLLHGSIPPDKSARRLRRPES